MNDCTVSSRASTDSGNPGKPGYKETVLPDNAVTHGRHLDRAPLILLAVCRSLRNELSEELSQFNYRVVAIDISAHDKIRLIQDIYHYKPDVILLDYELLDDSLKFSLNIVQNFLCFKSTSIIFISKTYSTEKHLTAVAAGGSAFLTSPVDINSLVSTIDNICNTEETAPSKVTIIDDDAASANYYSAVLNSAGIGTCIITDPLNSVKELMATHPDLILLDLYMPDCNGQQLATVIRQQESLFNIPIVYLSGESDIDKQMLSKEQGIDDFLLKEVKPEHLVMSVTSRIKRSRQLKSLMIKDNLTGLLNRQAFHDRLNNEVSIAKRSNRPLSLAMLDLDYFKKVNDTYGHAEGDKILIYISTLLRRWLRCSDTICRYGGEEFIILMPDTKKGDAFELIEKIRKECSNHIHMNDTNTYSITFSCGIASLNTKTTSNELISIADEIMYKAKTSGRNRVLTSSTISQRDCF